MPGALVRDGGRGEADGKDVVYEAANPCYRTAAVSKDDGIADGDAEASTRRHVFVRYVGKWEAIGYRSCNFCGFVGGVEAEGAGGSGGTGGSAVGVVNGLESALAGIELANGLGACGSVLAWVEADGAGGSGGTAGSAVGVVNGLGTCGLAWVEAVSVVDDPGGGSLSCNVGARGSGGTSGSPPLSTVGPPPTSK